MRRHRSTGVQVRVNHRPKHPRAFEPRIKVQPKLTAGRYVFPVYGPTSYVDTFGAGRADVSYHHGVDIFGQLGQPLIAVADGTVFSVGWNRIGGNLILEAATRLSC